MISVRKLCLDRTKRPLHPQAAVYESYPAPPFILRLFGTMIDLLLLIARSILRQMISFDIAQAGRKVSMLRHNRVELMHGVWSRERTYDRTQGIQRPFRERRLRRNHINIEARAWSRGCRSRPFGYLSTVPSRHFDLVLRLPRRGSCAVADSRQLEKQVLRFCWTPGLHVSHPLIPFLIRTDTALLQTPTHHHTYDVL